MEYNKKINWLQNTPNQPTKFRRKNWIQINDGSRGMYNTNSQIKFKPSVLRRSLYDYSHAYILVSGTIIIIGARNNDAAKRLDERNKGAIFKNCAPFTGCISKINNTQTDNAKYIDIVLIEYSDNYSKTSGSLWQYYRDDPSDNITRSESFKNKTKITGKNTAAGNTKEVKIAVPLNYLSNFWRTLEMPLINFELISF